MKSLLMAIEGTVVMNDDLKEIMDNMYDARVPKVWERVSWQSSTLGFWFTELLERDSQFKRWCFNGRPKVFWPTGFFNVSYGSLISQTKFPTNVIYSPRDFSKQ